MNVHYYNLNSSFSFLSCLSCFISRKNYILSLCANSLARSLGQVKLDSNKWKLWKNFGYRVWRWKKLSQRVHCHLSDFVGYIPYKYFIFGKSARCVHCSSCQNIYTLKTLNVSPIITLLFSNYLLEIQSMLILHFHFTYKYVVLCY